jgi:hypothetical protein
MQSQGHTSRTARATVHFEVEVLFGTLYQPACENAAGRHGDKPVEMSPHDDEVTCRKCLKALGYDIDRMAA